MWREFLLTHRGRITGISAALLLGFVYLFAGFWDMLFFSLLLWIGYYFGKQKDESAEPIIRWSRIVEWVNDRWRWYK
ncbi:DUF2273 domain-containing protein [Paenibacillaceae bacterium]|nr:DUF2273 domain-containing protein [Paenibacillaceae bacterium]